VNCPLCNFMNFGLKIPDRQQLQLLGMLRAEWDEFPRVVGVWHGHALHRQLPTTAIVITPDRSGCDLGTGKWRVKGDKHEGLRFVKKADL
jgi:hypothetical protein